MKPYVFEERRGEGEKREGDERRRRKR